jgi:5-methylcytosine-specific restriction endonuclease McrA
LVYSVAASRPTEAVFLPSDLRTKIFVTMTTEKSRKAYKDFHGKPKQIKLRSMRNQARKKMGLEVGDPEEVDHVRPLSRGGNNNTNNLRVVSRYKNRQKGNRI